MLFNMLCIFWQTHFNLIYFILTNYMTPLPTVHSQSPVNKGGTANVMLILRQIPGFKETFDNQVIHFLKWNGFKSPIRHFENTSSQLSLCIYTYHITLGDKRRLPIIFNLFSHNLTLSIYILQFNKSFDIRGFEFNISATVSLRSCE